MTLNDSVDANTGNFIWRHMPIEPRKVHRFIPKNGTVILIANNYTVAEVYNLDTGKIENTVKLNKNEHKLPFSDAVVVSATKDNITYAVMSNIEVQIYTNHKLVHTHMPAENVTLLFIGYDYERDTIVIGDIEDGADEARSWPLNNVLKPFTFKFNPYSDILLKTTKEVVMVRMPPHAESTMIIVHNMERRDILFNQVDRDVGGNFQIKDFILPSSLIVFSNWKEISLTVLEDSELKKIQAMSAREAEYGFGADLMTSHAYMCRSDEKGYTLFVAEPKKVFKAIFKGGDKLNRRLFGEPEIIWADLQSDMILLRSSDKSLHMIQKKKLLWTQKLGIGCLVNTIYDDGQFFALSRFSKVSALKAETGENTWQRCAIGQITDIFLHPRGESKNLAFVISSTDVSKTRISEVVAKDGSKTEYNAKFEGFAKGEARMLKDLTLGSAKENVFVMLGTNMKMNAYPDTVETNKLIEQYKDQISIYLCHKVKKSLFLTTLIKINSLY